jgi:ribonuclease Z
MTRQYLFAAAALLGAATLTPLAPTVGSVAPGIALAQGMPAASALSAPPSDSLKVVLLGTGAGPVVNLQQYGASTLVEAGGQRFLFDCGRGATLRLAQAGVPVGSITRVFLTHLHSDHVVQLPDLLLTGWSAGRRVVPLAVWGPAGPRARMDHLLQAFDFDIHVRRDVDERFPAAGIMVVSHDIMADGVVFAEGGVTVTAFLVDHGVVRPAYGYRVDYGGRSVVLSGDTRVSENLIRHARGVDVLIHETIDPEALRRRVDRPSEATIGAIVAHHATPEEAGTVFRRVAPRLAVYSHAPNTSRVMAQTRTTWSGPLLGAEDLLTLFIGAEIRVEHHASLPIPPATPPSAPREPPFAPVGSSPPAPPSRSPDSQPHTSRDQSSRSRTAGAQALATPRAPRRSRCPARPQRAPQRAGE